MKMAFRTCLALLCCAAFLAAADDPGRREERLINREWTFTLGDVPASGETGFDDSAWSRIHLPHSFSAPALRDATFYTGYGWHRKHLVLSQADLADRLCRIEFDGVFQDTEVFVNGTPAGRHLGDYNGFTFDLTKDLKAGDNLMAVRVNNVWNPRLAPRAGDHTFCGGIYRNVRLVFTDRLHVTWYGTFVTTPEVSKESATTKVKTEILNAYHESKPFIIRAVVLEAQGQVVATIACREELPSGVVKEVDQTLPMIANPLLWHPDHPNLDTLVKTITIGDRVAERIIS